MKKNSIESGPLARVEKRLEDFSFNLYFSFMFNESVEAHRKLEDQYLEAFLAQDYEQMQKINREISYMESAFEATACMLDATKGGFS